MLRALWPLSFLKKMAAAVSGSWQTVRTSYTTVSNSTGWNGWTARERVLASSLTDLTASQIRISIKGGTNGLKIAKMYVDIKGSGTYDFTGTPTQVFFGGSASKNIAADTVEVSDAVTFAYDGTSDLVVGIYHDNTAEYPVTNDTSRSTVWQKFGDDAATVTPSGGSTGFTADLIWLIEAFA